MSQPRCTTIRLDLRDLARSAEDPKLAALVAEGWVPIANIAIEDGGPPGLVIVLAPPKAAPAPASAAAIWNPWDVGGVVLVVAFGLLLLSWAAR